MLDMLIRIIRTEGVSGTFKGFAANMINTFSMRKWACSFLTHRLQCERAEGLFIRLSSRSGVSQHPC